MVPPFACESDTAPFAYVSGPLNVVVAVHVGVPLRYARTCPAVPAPSAFCLLLNVVQSDDVSRPSGVLAPACGRDSVYALLLSEKPQPPVDGDDDANVDVATVEIVTAPFDWFTDSG